VGSGGWLNLAATRRMAADLIARFNVKAGGPDAAARSLSGGNLQKFIVGREIDARPKLLIVSQPTWGVDVGRRRRSGANCWPCATRLRPAGGQRGTGRTVRDQRPPGGHRAGRLSPSVATADATREMIGEWMSGLWEGAHAEA
jgi:simple sugar transport system ATP-binding protein